MSKYMALYQSFSEHKLEIQHSIHTLLNKWNQFYSQAKLHKFSKICALYYTYYICVCVCVCVCIKSFSIILDKVLRQKNQERDGEVGKHRLNQMGTLNIKYKNETNQIKVKDHHIIQSFLNMAAHQKAHLELWRKKAITGLLYYSENSKIILTCICILKSDHRLSY